MSKIDVASTPVARNWRDIPQTVAPRAMSAEGRRRLAFSTVRLVAAIVVTVALLWGGFEIWRTWESAPYRLAASSQSEPVKTIELRTDGVLDHAWVTSMLALPRDAGLMDLDLPALQARLTAGGQVHTAVLLRKFPATLAVTLQERTPVVRVRAALGAEPPRDFLVARDGTVFAGAGYAPVLTESLPWLDGVRLVRSGPGFARVPGLEILADLLAVTQANAPALYRSWTVVDLGRLASDGEIVVRAREVPEVVFGTRDDFFTQVAMLDATLEQLALNPALPRANRINLAVGGRQVPVAFNGAPARAPEPARTPSFFPSVPRNSL